MVLRYWGERDVFPQDFASLVTPGAGGIVTGDLAAAVRARGWQALTEHAAVDVTHLRIRSEIDRGRPVIALIEVGPRTYHYVVIVGGTDHDVVVHDPARSAFRVQQWADFDRTWAPTGRWMMLVLPPTGGRAGSDATPPAGSALVPPFGTVPAPCDGLMTESVTLALAGDPEGAEHGLRAAAGLCPNDPGPWRELAGLRFSQSRWAEAQHMALSAVRLAPRDAYAWQLVATSRALMGDRMGALDAWNRTDEPRIDAVGVHGAERIRQPVVVRASGLQPRQVLTPEVFGRALRRLRDVPAASAVRMGYEPIDGGLANVDVFIDERQALPHGWPTLAVLGARALLQDELRIDVAGLLGAGELGTASWRWSAGRPRVALGLALPSPEWFHGIVSLDGSWERQSYDPIRSAGDTALVREERRRVGLHVAHWSTSWLRWQTGAALDRMRPFQTLGEDRVDARSHLALESALDVRLAGDRLTLAASGGWWTPFAGRDRFATGALLAAWRSSAGSTGASWSAVSEVGAASRVAPLALWYGAGTGQGRPGLLRAHPLLDDNVLTGGVFGRVLARASIEYVRPVPRIPAGAVSVAGFSDIARAWRRRTGSGRSALFVDVGAGLRLHTPGLDGSIRVDVARGLRGGGTTLSAGWGGAWPR